MPCAGELMRRLVPILASLLICGSASAQNRTDYLPFTMTHQDSTRLHVAWIEDDLGWINSTSANRSGAARDYAQQLVNLRDMLRKGGIEVHVYSYSFFGSQQYGDSIPKWANLGNSRSSGGGGYAVAFCPGWYGQKGSGSLLRYIKTYTRYWRACSTSAQIIHFAMPVSMAYDDNPGAVPDSALGNLIAASSGVQTLTASSSPGAPQRQPRVASSPGDTFFIARAYGMIPQTNRPPGGTLVRLFNVGAQQSEDTVATATTDTLWIAYRVRYANQGHARTPNPYTDFIMGGESPTGANPINNFVTPVAWALMSRHVRLPAIPAVLSFNDYTSFGSNPNNSYRWPRATYLDTVFTDLRATFGVQNMVVGVNPDSAALFYWRDYGYQSNKHHPHIRWGLHWHNKDSTTVYATAHGRSNENSTASQLINIRRVANRYNPGNASLYLRYGIRQTIALSDSLLRAAGVQTVNYFQPGNDITVPTYWQNNDWPISPNATAVAGRDSMFQAFAAAGKTLIAGSPFTGTSLGARASASSYVWSTLPEETYTCANGAQIRFSQYIGVSSSFGGGPLSIAGALNSANSRTTAMMGLVGSVPAPVDSRIAYGYGQTTNTAGQHWIGGNGRVRGWESHAQFFTNENNGIEMEYQILKWCVLRPVKALNAIAGHTVLEWSTPEVAFGRY